MSAELIPEQNERRLEGAAFVIAVALATLAVVIAVDTYNLPEGIASYARVGPRAFPYAISAVMGMLALATAIAAWRGKFPERPKDEYAPLFWIVGGLVLQLLLIGWAGFAIATGAVFAATAQAFGRGPLWTTYPIGVGISLLIWIAFAKGLNLILPAGPLERLF